MTEPSDTLRREFGDNDIYLFDQQHRGNITIGMRVLDAGFGQGRNLVYLLRQGFDVSGVDTDAAAIDAVRRLVRATPPTRTPGFAPNRWNRCPSPTTRSMS